MDFNNILSRCNLCPRNCGSNRIGGDVGFCGAGANLKIARAELHFWEEPCISGKKGSGAVFFAHCNLRCAFCQNYEISTGGKGYEVSIKELADIFLRLQNEGANNINLVTPTHFVPQIISALDIAKRNGLSVPIIYNCGGYESVDTLKMLKGYIDVYLPDMKYFSDKFSEKYSSAKNYVDVAKKALEEMYNQVGSCKFNQDGIIVSGMIVRHLLLPKMLFESKKVIDYLFDKFGDNIWISLMSQYTPMEQTKNIQELNQRVPIGQYNTLVDYCVQKGMENVFIQEDASADKKFIPKFYNEKMTEEYDEKV